MRAGRRGTAAGRFCAFAAEKRERGSRNGGREGGCAGEEAPHRSPGPLPRDHKDVRRPRAQEGGGRGVFSAPACHADRLRTRVHAPTASLHTHARAPTPGGLRARPRTVVPPLAHSGSAGCVSGSPAGGEETTGKAPGPRPVSLRPPGGPPATCSRKLELAKAVANTRLPGPASISFAYLS